MRTAIHPDHLLLRLPFIDECAKRLPDWLDQNQQSLPDADVPKMVNNPISADEGNALAFVCRQDGLVPTFRFEASGIIDRKACIVADFNALAVVDVFVGEVAPLAREVDLRASRCGAKAQTHKGTK